MGAKFSLSSADRYVITEAVQCKLHNGSNSSWIAGEMFHLKPWFFALRRWKLVVECGLAKRKENQKTKT